MPVLARRHLASAALLAGFLAGLPLTVATAGPASGSLDYVNVTASRVQPTVPEDVGPQFKEVDFGDFDNDGDLDVAISNAAGTFGSRRNKLYRNDRGVFVEVSGTAIIPEFANADVTRHVGFRDVNADGWLDLVVANDAYEFGDPLLLFINRHANGVFQGFSEEGATRGLGLTNDWPCGAVSEDVDGDGDIDIVLGNYAQAQDALFFNDGTGHFTEVTTGRMPTSHYSVDVAAGDVNGDGKLDLLMSNEAPYQVLYNDLAGAADQGPGDYAYGQSGQEGVQPLGASLNHGALEPGDFDGDGDTDIYWGNRIDFADVIFVNGGNDATGKAILAPMDLNAYVQAVASHKATVADLDGDGRDDLVVMTADRPAILRNTSVNGAISFVDWTPGDAFPAGAAFRGAHAAAFDADGDGDLDLFVGGDTDDHLFLRTAGPVVDEDDLVNGVVPLLLDADPVTISGLSAQGVGETDLYVLADVAGPARLSIVLNGPHDYRLDVLADCTVVATSDRGGAGVEEALEVTIPAPGTGGGAPPEPVTWSVRVSDQGPANATAAYTLELLARTDLVAPVDPTGWATSVIGFSSEYSPSDWAATQALGVPDTFEYGDIATAWAPLPQNGSQEFITLGFDPAEPADAVTIRETYGNGFVTQVDLLDTVGTYHTVWTGVDPSAPGAPVDFVVSFPPTGYEVAGVRVHVDTNATSGWEEIDAVRLHALLPPGPGPVVSGDCNGNGTPDDCDIAFGTSADLDGDGIPDECGCPADLDGSGGVGFADLNALLGAWGPCVGCVQDLDGNGTVGFGDLNALLAAWGVCSDK